MPWKGWLRRSQPPWLKTQLKTEVAAAEGWQGQGHWRKGCIHQVQQVTMTETMRSSSRAPPRREVFLYLCGRCQPVAHSLKKVLARERSRKAPEGCCGAISSSSWALGKQAFLLWLYLPRCDAHSTHGFLAVAFMLFVLQNWVSACCRAVLCLPAIPSAVCSFLVSHCSGGCRFAFMKETKA